MTHAEDIIEHAPSILLVDDDSAFRAIYGRLLAEEGFAIIEADDRPSARDAFAAGGFDVVLLDLMLPPDGSVSQGMEMLGEFLRQRPDAKIVVVSGAGDMRFVLEAVRQGAYDFITKPADPDVLGVVVQRAVTRARLERRVSQLQNALSHSAPGTRMIGKAPAFTRALGLAERVAPSELPVLITGEHGTGKELMARTIHEHSLRAAEPFLPINCGALTESLLESTLFGHVKGAFTGAHRDRAGLFAQADGGTLFLDEIGDMPASLQVKVLRALEYGEILPVGADRPMHVDVRLISATNKDLHAMLTDEWFREDLYWRIKGTEIRLPSLRERLEDIPPLAAFFLNGFASLSADGRPKRLSPEAEASMIRHGWPGNLRELRHEMQRATVMVGSSLWVTPEDLSFVKERASGSGELERTGQTLQEKVQLLEIREIRAALVDAEDNRTHAAKALGLSRQGLLNKMERYGLS